MKAVTKLVAATFIAGVIAVAAYADPPTGPILLPVHDEMNTVFDAGAAQPLKWLKYDVEIQGYEIDIEFGADFHQDGAGKLAGSGRTPVSVESFLPIQIESASYIVTGSITSKGGVTRLTHTATAAGNGYVDGEPSKFNTSRTVMLTFGRGMASGTMKASASAAGKTAKNSGPLDVSWEEVQAEVGSGAWTLDINDLTTDAKNKITGSAAVELETGTSFNFAIKGVYNPKTGASVLTLAGVGTGRGASLKVTLQGNDVTSIIGKISGQSVSVR